MVLSSIFNESEQGEETVASETKSKNEMQTIKLFYTNINGLNVNKIKDANVIKDTLDADIICFTETHLSEHNLLPIDQYDMIETTSKTKNNFGRQIKGINLYYKTKDMVIENIIAENGDMIIIEVKNKQWKEVDKIHMIFCYRESRESKHADKYYLNKIKDYIGKFRMKHIIILGDFNSRTGNINDNKHLNIPIRNSEDLIINKQGRELIDFCNENSLIIANGRLENGEHTFCRLQNDKCYKSVIDYLILSESMLKNIEAFKIMEPKLYTDHIPIKIDLKIPIKPAAHRAANMRSLFQKDLKKRIIPFRWRTERNLEKYRQTVSEKGSKLLEDMKDKKLNKTEIYDEIVKINKESLPTAMSSNSRPIYSEDTRILRKAHKQNVEVYKNDQSEQNLCLLLQTKRKLNKNIKRERRILQQMELKELHEAKAKNDVKKYWEILNRNKPHGKNKYKTTLNVQSFKNNIQKRDNETKNLNDNTNISANQKPPSRNDDALNQKITIAEVENAIKYSKSSKSSGPDKIVYEMLKNDTNQAQILCTLFNQVMNDHNTPWHSSWITPIFKKGNRNEADSYRCLNLSSCIEKLLTRILNDRLNYWIEKFELLHESQTGFRKEHSTIDNIWILKESIQIYKNDKRPLYTCFVDLSKAFDSIPKNRLIGKLKAILPTGNYLSLLENIIKDKTYKILFDGKESEEFQIENGIPQGDSLSPALFCIYINDFLTDLYHDIDCFDPIKLGNSKLAALIYADDILLLSETHTGIIKQIRLLHKFCKINSLKINYDKTKIMTFGEKQKYDKVVILGDNISAIEVVDQYKYLGFWIAKNDRKHIEELTKKGKSSSYVTAKTLKEFNSVDGRIINETFEMLTLSKMKYGSELFFDKNLTDLNRIIVQFYKRYYHLRMTTPTYCIIGEFGVKPIEYYCYKSAIIFFIKLNKSEDKRLITRIFKTIKCDMENTSYRNTWYARVSKLFNKVHFTETQSSEYSRNIKKLINNVLTEYFRKDWIDSAKLSNKGLKYLELCRFQCELKPYIMDSRDKTKIDNIIKLRTGNHTLAAEVGTYQNRTTYKDCICKFCDLEENEDIYHFIVVCPRYCNERDALIPYLKDATRSDFYAFMNSLTVRQIRPIDDYIDKAMNVRNHR